ncbi:hypothetical protein Curi_c09690 [Gottschalkia acidurici 9a]|uniref:Uncharacterized protein n=1 Tax=Gottschalkia acidurici (strain ATCC 7906 / DSM 604 / BCRC 14475 / CIP 104303 / KCTC 5404 / NCIMB 10678 / 9a) TaxID=1128398 RepID=K0AZ65_GOTA9|nr:hypothetical protein [Gottschalkia acidurici]AFS77985.1 hypothetical protein Curi_c09690 [Gottschalkia acidurici 9a]
MLNDIRETRSRDKDGLYQLTLEVSERDFFGLYDEVDKDSALDLLKQYLVYRQDDGRPSDIEIDHNKNNSIIVIKTKLHYLGNDHTEQP